MIRFLVVLILASMFVSSDCFGLSRTGIAAPGGRFLLNFCSDICARKRSLFYESFELEDYLCKICESKRTTTTAKATTTKSTTPATTKSSTTASSAPQTTPSSSTITAETTTQVTTSTTQSETTAAETTTVPILKTRNYGGKGGSSSSSIEASNCQ